jgi:hypothetical protein
LLQQHRAEQADDHTWVHMVKGQGGQTMAQSVGGRRIALLESYGRRQEDAQGPKTPLIPPGLRSLDHTEDDAADHLEDDGDDLL